jgi:glutaminyl-peptide cyclotransferase
MNRISTLLLSSFVGLALTSCGGASGPIDGDRAKAHAAKIIEFGPRPAGSKNLTLAATYIKQQIQQLGLEPQEQLFEVTKPFRGKDTTTKFQNLFVEIPGKDPVNGPLVVIGAHYDSKLTEGHDNPKHNFHFVGAMDAAGATGLLVELVRHLKDRKSDVTYLVVWFDGEESMTFDWSDDLALFGSQHFVQVMKEDKRRFPNGMLKRMHAMVLLDLIGDVETKIDRDTASSTDLVQIVKAAAEKIGESDRVHRYDGSFKDDHLPFIRAGVPAVNLIDFTARVPPELGGPPLSQRPPEWEKYFPWWHTPEDKLERLSGASLAFVGNLLWAALPDIEAFAVRLHAERNR